MPWGKPKFYYEHNLSGLVATSTATGLYDVANLLDRLEGTFWKAANTTTPMYITFDAGSGNTVKADYLAISGHNLNTIGATIVLQYSTDNFSADINDAFTAFAPPNDLTLVKEFTSQTKRYWRLKITGTLSAAPYIAICYWGELFELDYCTVSFDPHAEEDNASDIVSHTGVLQEVDEQWTERAFAIGINGVETGGTLDNAITTWKTAIGLLNFCVAWNISAFPNDIWLMRRKKGKFVRPFQKGGLYRNVSIPLVGRKEI